MSPDEFRAEIDKLAAKATDAGRLVELGFLGYRKHVLTKDASDREIVAARMAFFTGAQHLFGSIMGILSEGEEITEKDLQRMALVEKELADFYACMQAHVRKKMI